MYSCKEACYIIHIVAGTPRWPTAEIRKQKFSSHWAEKKLFERRLRAPTTRRGEILLERNAISMPWRIHISNDSFFFYIFLLLFTVAVTTRSSHRHAADLTEVTDHRVRRQESHNIKTPTKHTLSFQLGEKTSMELLMRTRNTVHTVHTWHIHREEKSNKQKQKPATTT